MKPPRTKAKRGRKRKSAVPEADAPEPKVKVARISNAPESARGSVAQMSGTQFNARSTESPSGADVVAEDAEDEIAVRGIENQWTDPQLGSV